MGRPLRREVPGGAVRAQRGAPQLAQELAHTRGLRVGAEHIVVEVQPVPDLVECPMLGKPIYETTCRVIDGPKLCTLKYLDVFFLLIPSPSSAARTFIRFGKKSQFVSLEFNELFLTPKNSKNVVCCVLSSDVLIIISSKRR